jgi:hypothetical protein
MRIHQLALGQLRTESSARPESGVEKRRREMLTPRPNREMRYLPVVVPGTEFTIARFRASG